MNNVIITPTPRKLIILYIILSAIIIFFGINFYFQRRNEIRSRYNSELISITEDKSKRIERWLTERIGDANIFKSNSYFVSAFRKYLTNPNDSESKKIIDERTASYKLNLFYSDIILTDKNFIPKYPPSKTYLETKAVENIRNSISENSTLISTFVKSEIDSSIFIDVAAPLYDGNNLIGGIILRNNPDMYLYPVIYDWPVDDQTAESGIMSVDGNEIVVFSKVRFLQNSAPVSRLKIDSSTSHLTAIKAAKGLRGLSEGYDYRGKATLNYIHEIEGTDWIIVSKIDKEEVFARLNRDAFIQIFVTVLLLLFIGIMLYWVWSNRKKSLLIQKLEEENKRKLIEKNYEYFVKYANDVIILSDENLKIIDVNTRATELYGYTRDEMLKMNIRDLLTVASDESCIIEITDEAKLKDGIIFDAEHKTKGGNIIQIEVSLNIIEVDGKIFYQRIIRNISERKAAEEKLRESENMTRTLINASADAALMLALEGTLLTCNDRFLSIFGKGKTKEELIGKNAYNILSKETARKRREFMEIVIKEKTHRIFIENDEENGLIIEQSLNPLLDKDGNVYSIAVFARDITQVTKASEAIRLSEEKYRSIFENTIDVYHQVAIDGTIVEFSPSVEDLLGYKREELIGKSMAILHIDSKDIDTLRNSFINSDIIDDYELTLRHKDGSIVNVSVHSRIKNDSSGSPVGVEGVFRNIEERKKYEDSLKESERRYRTIIETMNDGIIQVDTNNNIIFVNESTKRILGYTSEELLGNNAMKLLVHPGDMEFIGKVDNQRKLGESSSYEVRVKNKKDKTIWLSVSSAPTYDNQGNITGSVGFITDITERKRSEAEILKISQAINQSPIIVLITDPDGMIEYVNPQFTKVTGYSTGEVIGKTPKIFKSGHTTKEEYKNFWDTILSGKEWNGEFYNRKKNGGFYWEKTSISSVKDANGKIINFIALKEDITAAKEKELELIRAKEQAEESERLKTNFLANMSHELRTPMVGILGFSELLKNSVNDPVTTKYAETILNSGKRLMETLNLILDLSRIEAGKLNVILKEMNIVTIVKESYENFIAAAKVKNLKITFSSTSDEIIASVDEKLLYESVNNLINNALKYTNEGSIDVSIITMNNHAFISIEDTGIGISEESLQTIFEEFRQASEGYSREFEGTGLGLTITKNFIEKTGGKIYVTSDLNKGSKFTIELPLTHSSDKNQRTIKNGQQSTVSEHQTTNDMQSSKILCVEDDEPTRILVNQILKNNYNVLFAESGEKAIELVKSEKCDLILMDINLGKNTSGVNVAKEIREIPGYENIRIIAMTAYAMTGDKEKFLSSGMQNYISKPFEKSALLKLVTSELKLSL